MFWINSCPGDETHWRIVYVRTLVNKMKYKLIWIKVKVYRNIKNIRLEVWKLFSGLSNKSVKVVY